MNKEILEEYIKNNFSLVYVCVNDFDIDGANCAVEYYDDENHDYKENTNINIWDMVLFLH